MPFGHNYFNRNRTRTRGQGPGPGRRRAPSEKGIGKEKGEGVRSGQKRRRPCDLMFEELTADEKEEFEVFGSVERDGAWFNVIGVSSQKLKKDQDEINESGRGRGEDEEVGGDFVCFTKVIN